MLYPNPQIYHHLKAIFVHIPKTAGTSIERQLAGPNRGPVGGHTTALASRRKFAQEFGSYFKFSVVREPLDRFISAFRYLRAESVHPAHQNAIIHRLDSMDAFVDAVTREPALLHRIVHMMPQNKFVCDANARVLVDKVYYFEHLEAAWQDICRRLAFEEIPLPRLNVSPTGVSVSSCSEATRAFVSEAYAADYRIFGYQT